MSEDNQKARVFISCGQSKTTEEPKIAAAIQEKLKQLGFEPYVAVAEQSLLGLRENLFAQLSKSEYFVFVDFKRERLDYQDVHRGSLFSHQELAIASYLEIEVLAFQEQGVKNHDGILGIVQGNATPFDNRATLPDLVAAEVKSRIETGKWKASWRNELQLSLGNVTNPHQGTDTGPQARYFHVDVLNRHQSKVARNCTVYLERIIEVGTGTRTE